MKVATRLAGGSALVFLPLLLVLAYEVGQVNRLAGLSRDLARSGIKAAELSLEQIRDLSDLDLTARKCLLSRDPDYARRAGELAGRIDSRRLEMASMALSAKVSAQVIRFESIWHPTLAATPHLLAGTGSEEAYLTGLQRAQDQAEAVALAARESVQEDASRAEEAARHTRAVSLAAAGIALLAGVVTLVLTVRSIQRPLARLTLATRSVAQGNFDQRLESTGNDEFAGLSSDFNVMLTRLGELDQMKKDLLSHVSHELKAPLAAMQETTQLMIEGLPGPVTEDQRRLLDLNLQSARRLFAMIAKLLDLSRMEAGVMEYDLRARDLTSILREACAGMEVLARERNIGIDLRLPPEPISVRCDGDRLFQVVANLVENALKFSPSGTEVTVGAEVLAALPPGAPSRARQRLEGDPQRSGVVLFTVADRGPGVPDDQKEKVFDRFHQVPRGHLRGGGVGLGLAICREIVEAHGGAIWAEDHGKQGSVFAVALPHTSGSASASTGEVST